MEILNSDYRIHITVRKRYEPIRTSHEYRTEQFNDLDDLLENLNAYVKEEIEQLEGEDG